MLSTKDKPVIKEETICEETGIKPTADESEELGKDNGLTANVTQIEPSRDHLCVSMKARVFPSSKHRASRCCLPRHPCHIGLLCVLWLASIVFAAVNLPNDAKALALISIPFVVAPRLTLLLFIVILVANLNLTASSVEESYDRNPKGVPNAINTLHNNYVNLLEADVLYPGLVGYFGWNYEAAVALEALLEESKLATMLEPLGLNQSELDLTTSAEQETSVLDILEQSLEFPQAGAFIKRGWPTFWLYSVGDRIGLYASLFQDVNEKVFKTGVEGTLAWPVLATTGLKTRNIGFGSLGGIWFTKRFVWADDVYMAGAVLMKDTQGQQTGLKATKTMLLGAWDVLLDSSTGLWWHGIYFRTTGDGFEIISDNEQKWGRANGWVLLTLARYVLSVFLLHETGEGVESFDSQDIELQGFLAVQLETFSAFQRSSGAFGNLVDDSTSSDETSLTSIFIYGVAVHHLISEQQNVSSTQFIDPARKAFDWLNTRLVEGLAMGDTCGAAPLGADAEVYESRMGVSEGPAVAFVLWAKVGANLLGFL